MKSNLQIRAERAAELFSVSARKTMVIEFAGVPKSGKSTTLNQVQAFLKRCGFRTEVVVERASVCPIRDKKHANFNIWTACTTLAHILEKTQESPRSDDPHILFLDRGLFDSICWMVMMEHLARVKKNDSEVIERFLRIADWRKRISGVIVMIVSPGDAMKREQGYLPINDVQGSIMNEEVLKKVRDTYLECGERLKSDFRIYTIDTSATANRDNPQRTAEIATELVLNLVEEQINEEILVISKPQIKGIFQEDSYLAKSNLANLITLCSEYGKYYPRESIEKDHNVVQVLPIVIVKNVNGDVLRLRRREKDTENPLHEKIVIWAGGHVRSEDNTNGDALSQCVIRELYEELRLSVEPSDLKPVGAVYIRDSGRTSNHVAIVYEWRAKTDDVNVAVSSSEFFERRGTSLSGSFVDPQTLMKDVIGRKITELWSVEIINNFLTDGSIPFSNRLL